MIGMHNVNVGEGITLPHAMCKDGVRMMRSKTVYVREDNIFPYEQTVRDGGPPAGCYSFTSTLVISQI